MTGEFHSRTYSDHPDRIPHGTARVLAKFAEDPAQWWNGFDLMEELSFPASRVHLVLAWLISAGWVTERKAGRDDWLPPRTQYQVTEIGVKAARMVAVPLDVDLDGAVRQVLGKLAKSAQDEGGRR